MRVFLDANVLFSAAYMDAGSPRALFLLAAAGACELVTSPYAIEEARRNMLVKRAERAGELAVLARQIAVQPEPSLASIQWATSLGLPAKDAPILAAALESRAHMLVTGDVMHFGGLHGKRHRGIAVLRPAEAVDIVMG
ncbi:MAG: PIN domain-containing protein [Usitatibacter sp.]